MPARTKDTAGPQIVATLENTFRKHVALNADLPLVLALWTLATHLFTCFDAFPYLAITSPTKRCGKTRLAEVIELLSCGAMRTASASSAAIFRAIQMNAAKSRTITLIMDEMEVLGRRSERSDQLREILNAGYRKGQYVLRCERNAKEQFEPREFPVYCPKVLVLIGSLTDTLADRCIPIAMRRRRPGERVDRFFYSQASRNVRTLLREIEAWAKANRRRVMVRLRRDIGFLEDREAELWLPLFAVCVAAPERVEALKAAALRLSRGKQSEEPSDLGILLLQDIRSTFGQTTNDRLTTVALIEALMAIAESPWQSWSHGRGLDARRLAKMLRPFGIEPHNLRIDGQILKGYLRADFEETWATYVRTDSAATPLQGSDCCQKSPCTAAT